MVINGAFMIYLHEIYSGFCCVNSCSSVGFALGKMCFIQYLLRL